MKDVANVARSLNCLLQIYPLPSAFTVSALTGLHPPKPFRKVPLERGNFAENGTVCVSSPIAEHG